MPRMELELDRARIPLNRKGARLLVCVVAYQGEAALEKVLARIPPSLRGDSVEILLIDDFSKDPTFAQDGRYPRKVSGLKLTVLRTPENQGHGGNQKLAFRYAIDRGFDFVALLRGDGQDAPEQLPALLAPLVRAEADAVFSTSNPGAEYPRTEPFPQRLVGKILTAFQNRMLGLELSEFRSGCRLYSTGALAQIPFEKNTDDLRFDTEVTIQLALKRLRIVQQAVPAAPGDERRDGILLLDAWHGCKALVRARLHQMNLFFDRKFDVNPPEQTYDLKLGFHSSHTAAIDAARPEGHVLDVGCGQGYVAAELRKKGCVVTGMDRYLPPDTTAPEGVDFIWWDLDRKEFPVNVSQFDQIFLLDIIEHLKEPETFMDELRFSAACKRPEVILTTANIGFWATRLMLLLGQFNYGKKGILDATHTRLFTFRSMRELLRQSGYKIIETRGIPAPFPKALGDNCLSRALLWLNEKFIRLNRGLFSYQIFVRAQALPTVENLLHETVDQSAHLQRAA